jgi:flagellar hook protein FlgE
MIRSLFSAVSGMMNSQTKMDIIGNNLANTNTVAFKANDAATSTSFEDPGKLPSTTSPTGLSVGLGSQIVGTVRQFTQGALQRTDVPTDLAIQGSGFFAVESDDGGTFVTRAGNFIRDQDGYLRTMNGMFVLGNQVSVTNPGPPPVLSLTPPALGGTAGFPSDRILVPDPLPNGERLASFSIGRDGLVSAVGADGVALSVAYIPLQKFANPNGLTDIGNNLFLVSAAAGDNRYFMAGRDGTGQIQSGALELSNVDMAKQFSQMIITQRSFEANARVISTSDEMLQTVTNIKR